MQKQYEWDETPADEYWERQGQLFATKQESKVAQRQKPQREKPRSPAEKLGPSIHWGTVVETGLPFTVSLELIDDSHGEIVGSSNRGKSRTMEAGIRQLLPMKGRGGFIPDVEGTLIKSTLNWLAHHQNREELAKKVIIVSPSLAQRTDMWPAFNVFKGMSDAMDKAVVADYLAALLGKAWGSESFHMPTFERVARTFMRVALDAELFMSELQYLNPMDKAAKDIRVELTSKVTSEIVRKEIVILETESSRDQKSDMLAFHNRYTAFSDVRAIQLMMDREQTLDWDEIFENGYWVLADLSENSGLLSAGHGYLCAAFMLSEIMERGLKRTEQQGKAHPFYVWADEFRELAHPELPRAFNRLRKRGIHFFAGHQDIAAFEDDYPALMSAVIGNTDLKIYMGMNNTRDSKRAEEIMFVGTHDAKEVKDEIINPMTVAVEEEKVQSVTKANSSAEISNAVSGSGAGSSGLHMVSPDGDLLGMTVADSDFTSDLAGSGVVDGESTAVNESTRLRPVFEDRVSGRSFYTPEEQRMENQAKFHALEPQFAYVKLRAKPPVLVKIIDVPEYPDNEQLLLEFWELTLAAHRKYYLPEATVLEVRESRKKAFGGGVEDDAKPP